MMMMLLLIMLMVKADDFWWSFVQRGENGFAQEDVVLQSAEVNSHSFPLIFLLQSFIICVVCPDLLSPPWGWRRVRWSVAGLTLGGGEETYGETFLWDADDGTLYFSYFCHGKCELRSFYDNISFPGRGGRKRMVRGFLWDGEVMWWQNHGEQPSSSPHFVVFFSFFAIENQISEWRWKFCCGEDVLIR